jgi:hypothetical protein
MSELKSSVCATFLTLFVWQMLLAALITQAFVEGNKTRWLANGEPTVPAIQQRALELHTEKEF